MTDNSFLDTRSLLCPLPVLKARKRLQSMAAGDELSVLADDPAAVIDMPHFCTEQGHTLVGMSEQDGAQLYVIRKG
ncbi:sulfurtransferase TusA family protein [Alisedimentitalea sp. MJ-SS2]|uniref:sulfurtransferase TusA family protein n=1 Tax=Aliisedimentitalea sp. MJ-SS2 TaxID=3049795 RepID=UPI002912AAB2|nr:sulfurtransferase TusA family protein [Alisedimentitalea sp. MJ-SS2]MDU8926839.1 sulfurtransferase TusA family protein [Alisedimentitalea sp. MJ-SS2]